MTSVLVLARDDDPSRPSVLVRDLVAALRGRGALVDRLDPDRRPWDLAVPPEHDVVVLKSGTEAALSSASAIEASGSLVVNPARVAAACRDKVVQTHVLLQTGVRLPQSWFTTDPVALADELRGGPLIFKDPRGSRGRGIAVVTSLEQLRRLEPGRSWLVMRYHPPAGPDLKVYRIGAEVFGVARTFPATTWREKLGRPVEVPSDVARAVRQCGEAFGIEVYGVDVVFSAGRWWVVDMSSFPGFKGVPDAGCRIADLLVGRHRRSR